MTTQQIYNEELFLTRQIHILSQKLKAFPAEDLICLQNGSYSKWFINDHSERTYLPKNQRVFAQQLALKKFYSLQLKEYEQKLHLLGTCQMQYAAIPEKANSLLEESSPYRELLLPSFTTFQNSWSNAEYEKSTLHPDNKIFRTFSGENVRSKSEVIIANELFANHIPYRYECGLYLDAQLFFPDFTILHPKTNLEFYWEHFGMMDNQQYSDRAFNKLKIYSNHNIVPTINLITTFETLKHPIDSSYVEHLIQDYFL